MSTSLESFLILTDLISSSSAKEIASNFSFKEIPRNDFHLRAGNYSNEYLFLEKGFLRSFATDLKGNEITTGFYGPGQVVFEVSSFFKRTQSKENIQALAESEGYFLTYEELNRLFHGMPEFREFGRSVLVKGFAALKGRMLSMITETAEQRYHSLLHHNPGIFQASPLKYIASYLGITDTSLSRIRRESAS